MGADASMTPSVRMYLRGNALANHQIISVYPAHARVGQLRCSVMTGSCRLDLQFGKLMFARSKTKNGTRRVHGRTAVRLAGGGGSAGKADSRVSRSFYFSGGGRSEKLK